MEIIRTILLFIIAFACGELIAFVVFYFVREFFDNDKKHTRLSIFKGLLERFILLLGLASSLPTIIVFFAALKLGTRLKDQQESKISNDYFLVGNITSVVMSILEFLFYQQLSR